MPVSVAKINRPRLSEIYPRKRLFRHLDLAVERPIVWVSAPAGSGKTTLIASWLDARKLPCLWYQVDEGDGDIATFFYYLGLAAKKAAPRHRKPLPLFTPEYLQGISTFTRRYFEKLFSRLKTPCVLVFDNFQEVPPDCLSVVPPGVNVIFISRGAPPATMAPLKAGRRLATLGWEEMRLTLDETAGIAALQSKEGIRAESIRRMHETTQGWAAGVILMAESTASDGDAFSLPGKGDLAEVFDYFAAEILAKTSMEVQGFLLKTSLLPKMTAKMAERLTGLEQSERILSHLVRNHYFTQKHADSEPVYQYHPLFRDFLLSRFRDTYSETEISGLRRQAAVILADSGQFEDAAELLREAGEWQEFVPLVLSHTQSLMMQGRLQTLEEWLRSIPAEIVENNPWLLYWQGACRLPFAPAESRGLFERAFQLFTAKGDPAGTLLAWSGVVDTFHFEWNVFTPLDWWIAWLDEHITREPSFPSPEIEARVSASMCGALIFRQPTHPAIGKWVERSLSLSKQSTDLQLRQVTCMNAMSYFLWRGDVARCGMVVDELAKSAGSPAASPLLAITLKMAQAVFFNWSTADHDLSLRLTTEALETAEASGVHVWDHFIPSHGVYAALNNGNTEMAAEFLGKMEAKVESTRGFGLCHYLQLSCWHDLIAGQARRAVAHAEASLQIAEKSGIPLSEMKSRLQLAEALQEAGEREKAAACLAHAGELIGRSGSLSLEFMWLLASAQFALDSGDEPAGLSFLRRGMALGRQQGYANMFWWWRPDVMAGLCVKALEADIEVEYVQGLIRKRSLVPEKPPVELENWPWPLKIYTLRRFALVIAGEPVSFSGKVQQKPLALLKALIALGGREVSEEQLSDHLWPDSETSALRTAFNTNLHRLRKLIGDDRAILMSDGKITLNPRLCWVDAWAFERLCGEVEAILNGNTADNKPANLIRPAEKAMALYQGSFLAGDAGEPWAISRRERLRSRFLHLIGKLGESLEGTGKWRKAAECYRKGLETDDLAEEFYQKLMVCHQHLGNQAEALKVYERCRTTLAAVLSVTPSARTRAIYKAIADRQ
ncbi:MAG: transcriptional [Geobacteraceae bacterium]|nr:MAG: transcriptional [Geobacteraceae bacterium]